MLLSDKVYELAYQAAECAEALDEDGLSHKASKAYDAETLLRSAAAALEKAGI